MVIDDVATVSPETVPKTDDKFWQRLTVLRNRRQIRGEFATITQAKRELFFFCMEPFRREASFLRASKDSAMRAYRLPVYQAVMVNFTEAIGLQVYGESLIPSNVNMTTVELLDRVVNYHDRRTIVLVDEVHHVYAVVG